MCSWQHGHTWGLQSADCTSEVTGAEQLTPLLGHNDPSQRLAAELGVSPGLRGDRSSRRPETSRARRPGELATTGPRPHPTTPPYRALAIASRTETCLAHPSSPSRRARGGDQVWHPERQPLSPSSESGTGKAWRAASNGVSVSTTLPWKRLCHRHHL
jgi:hypothetical protein